MPYWFDIRDLTRSKFHGKLRGKHVDYIMLVKGNFRLDMIQRTSCFARLVCLTAN